MLDRYHTFSQSYEEFVSQNDAGELFVDEVPLPACDPSGQGDFIADTPAMNMSTQDGLPGLDCNDLLLPDAVLPDTCPDLPGVDPVFNYMNYLNAESCFAAMGSFTCNQIERMYELWFLYRDSVNSCEEGEMEIEFEVNFDVYFVAENKILLTSADGTEYFNSDIHLDGGQHFTIQTDSNTALFVDLCVPVGDYIFSFTDSLGDGLEMGAFAVVRVNGVVVGQVEGNFGEESIIFIEAASPAMTTMPSTESSISTQADSPTMAPAKTTTTTNTPSACFPIPLTAALWAVGVIALFLSWPIFIIA